MSKPNELWYLLQTFAYHDGTLIVKQVLDNFKSEVGLSAYGVQNCDSQLREILQNDVKRLNSHLAKIFSVADQAIVYDDTKDCYQTMFKTSVENRDSMKISCKNYLLYLKSEILNPELN